MTFETVTEMETLLERPVESVAVAVMVCAPAASVVVSTVVLQSFVPEAVIGPFESIWTCTEAMPAGLEANPETVTVLDMVAPACGLEIETDGGALLTVTETDVLVDRPKLSVA